MEENAPGIQEIDVETAAEKIQLDGVRIVDIRDITSYQAGHIPGAEHLHDGNLRDFLTSADKTKPLICYCYHGISSRSAALYFLDQGFRDVSHIIGGYDAWQRKSA